MTKRDFLRTDGPWSFVVGFAGFLEQVIAGGLVGTPGLYFPYFKSAFQSSGAATSWVCSMTFVGWFIGSTLGSILVNRFGYRTCAFVGGTVSAVGLSLCMVATNFHLLVLFYGIFGCIGNGIHVMGFVTAVNVYFKKYRASVQVLITVGSSVGFAVYSILIPILIESFGWRGSVFIQGGISLHVCALSLLLFHKHSKQPSSKKRTLRLSLLTNSRVLLFGVHAVLVMICETATYVHLPILIIDKGFSSVKASMAFLVFSVCNAVGKLVYSFPCKFSPILVYLITVFLFGVSALCFPFLSNFISVTICAGVAGFTGNMFSGYTTVVILELAGTEMFTDFLGVNFIFRAAGSVSSGPLAGLLYDVTHNYDNTFYMIAGLVFVACALLAPLIHSSKAETRSMPAGIDVDDESKEDYILDLLSDIKP